MAVKKLNMLEKGGAGKSAKSSPVKPVARKAASKSKPAVKKSAPKAKPAVKNIAQTAKPAAKKSARKATPVTPERVVSKVKQTVAPVLVAKQPKKSKPAVSEPAEHTEIRETRSTINTGNGSVNSVAPALRGHADIAKGIAERKAAAKAKSIARFSRPAVEKNKNLKKLTDKQSKEYEAMLLRLRDEISRQIAYLRGASLTRSDEVNPEEDGSDAFERQLALKLASNEGDAIFEIDEALQRIKEDTYGVCQDCGCIISPARLKALPFARRCVGCKAVAEKNRDVNDRRYF